MPPFPGWRGKLKVKRRQWLNDQKFLDLIGATNLIPGLKSTDMANNLGFMRVAWRELIVGDICFILPAMIVVMLLAWIYVQFGSTPLSAGLRCGTKPVVVAIIQALCSSGKEAIESPVVAVVSLA